MTICVVKWCNNRSEKEKKCDNISFHRIPTDPIIADKWINIIRLSRGEEYWKPNKSTRICSKHFADEDKYTTQGELCKLRPTAVPTKDLHILLPAEKSDAVSNESLGSHGLQEIRRDGVSANECLSQPSTSHGIFRRPSDDESLFDTPRKVYLRRKLKKSTLLTIKHSKVIKSLKQKTRRLQKKITPLKELWLNYEKRGSSVMIYLTFF